MRDNIYLYTYVREEDLDSIMDIGLASSVRISKDKRILDKIYKSDKERKDFVSKVDESDITQRGPSAFFTKPLSADRVKDIDPDHALAKGNWVLIKIDYSKLKEDDPSAYIYGLELLPYEDKDYEKVKSEVEGVISGDKLNKYTEMTSEEAWSEFKPMSGYFAANVPHGIIVNKGGLIEPKYLSLSRLNKISKFYNSLFK